MSPVRKAIYMTAGVATLASISQNVGGSFNFTGETAKSDDVYVGTVTRDDSNR